MNMKIAYINYVIEHAIQTIERIEGKKIKRDKPIAELTDKELKKVKVKNRKILKQRKDKYGKRK